MPRHRWMVAALSLGSAGVLLMAPIARADEINNAFPEDPHNPVQVLADAEPEITDRIPVEPFAAAPAEVQDEGTMVIEESDEGE